MAKTQVTMKDVAEMAGVAVSTVSRVLNNSQTDITISDETRLRVQEAIDELSYRPHPGARLMRGKSTNLLGLIAREINDPFFANLIEVISATARTQKFDLVLGHAGADPNEAVRLSEKMVNLQFCDGLILLGDLQETAEDRTFLSKVGWNLPLVLLCRGSHHLVGQKPSISTDNYKGTSLGLEYLKELNHTQIAFLGGTRLGDLNERENAYVEFMTTNTFEVDPEYMQHVENNLDGGYQGMASLLHLNPPPTAIFASDDVMAMGAMKCALDQGIRIPEDISVIGFDDIAFSSYSHPALTTIRQPVNEIGHQCVALLIKLINNSGCENECLHVKVEPKLIIRDSCAEPRTTNI